MQHARPNLCSGVRPFGVSLLVAGYDEQGPQLFQVDPSGSYFAWKASAIGKNMTNAKTFLEKRYSDDMELEARHSRPVVAFRGCCVRQSQRSALPRIPSNPNPALPILLVPSPAPYQNTRPTDCLFYPAQPVNAATLLQGRMHVPAVLTMRPSLVDRMRFTQRFLR